MILCVAGGMVLLLLESTHKSDLHTVVDALFQATSAACLVGLTTVDITK